MKFYGQKREDEYLYNTFFKGVKNKIYIELGAMDGIQYSNTKFFQDELNWTGILIEPNIKLYEKLKDNRPDNKLYNSLVSNTIDDKVFKYFDYLGVSCIKDTMPKDHDRLYFNSKRSQFANHNKGECIIKTTTLETILDDSGYKEIDFLSLDVEGHEFHVLESINFNKVKIHVLLIEMLDDNSYVLNIEKLLQKNNYKYHSDIGRNRVYILQNSNYFTE